MSNKNSIYRNYGVSTPQTSPIPGREKDMVKNNAGGYTFDVGISKLFERFLILGITDTIYYAEKTQFFSVMADSLAVYLTNDDGTALAQILDVVKNYKAINLSPALFSYAFLCKKAKSVSIRSKAYSLISDIIGTPTQLFEWIDYCQNLGGWSRGMRRAVNAWYMNHTPESLAYHVVKYRQRNGWTHRDVWNKSHLLSELKKKGDTVFMSLVSLLRGLDDFSGDDFSAYKAYPIVEGYLRAKTLSGDALLDCIRTYKLTREMIPTEELNTEKVQRELILSGMPMTAMVRNISTFSRVGLNSDKEVSTIVANQIGNHENLKKAKLHPYAIFKALRTYMKGFGMRSQWDVSKKFIDALNSAFDASFDYVEPSGKKVLIGIDHSGSMGWGTTSDGISFAEIASIIALSYVKAESEENAPVVVGYDTRCYPVSMNKFDSLSSTINKMHFNGGGTDSSMPLRHAVAKGIKDLDAYIIITDNETWAGQSHTAEVLKEYRKRSGKPVKLIVIGIVASLFSIGDPEDSLVLNISGFSADTPNVISKFLLD